MTVAARGLFNRSAISPKTHHIIHTHHRHCLCIRGQVTVLLTRIVSGSASTYQNSRIVPSARLQCIVRLLSFSARQVQYPRGRGHTVKYPSSQCMCVLFHPHLDNDEELFSRLTLGDYILTLLEGTGFKSISNSESLPLIQRF